MNGEGSINISRETIHNLYHCIALFRQANIDYAICEALKRFPRRQAALIIYDICCQWFIHFRKRVSESEWLQMWDDIAITPAVGKWHLAAHVRECFAKFSLNFIEGSAEVDGEIMETLWSGLDLIAGITQGMTIAHRQEVLDDYINDSNWKKLLHLRKSCIQRIFTTLTVCTAQRLVQKWQTAKADLQTTETAYNGLSSCLEPEWIVEWTRDEAKAMADRGDAMEIYDVALEKGGVMAGLLSEYV